MGSLAVCADLRQNAAWPRNSSCLVMVSPPLASMHRAVLPVPLSDSPAGQLAGGALASDARRLQRRPTSQERRNDRSLALRTVHRRDMNVAGRLSLGD